MVFDMSGVCTLSPISINIPYKYALSTSCALHVAAGHQLHFGDPSVNILCSFQYMAKRKTKQNLKYLHKNAEYLLFVGQIVRQGR
jgi:hypothetical protein